LHEGSEIWDPKPHIYFVSLDKVLNLLYSIIVGIRS